MGGICHRYRCSHLFTQR
ncbi:MAG: hypothetical protein FJW98_06530 [Actinobacteria bacterium]|nr:hypothetical protein [Actinomycetota bacterium]